MIKLVDVDFIYPSGVHAIKNLSLEVKKGDFLSVMGGSGAGKSTLLKLLNGLLKPTRGKVYVDDIDTVESSVAELSRKVGIVFQNPNNQFFCEAVEKEIVFGLKNFGFPQKEINTRLAWALSFFNLEELRNLPPFNLSEGEKKRVAFASVIAWNPDYLVLDEPMLGQDFAMKKRIQNILTEFHSSGKTVILASHDTEFVAELNCKVAVMADGKIIYVGPALEVFNDEKTVAEGRLDFPELIKAFRGLKMFKLQEIINVEQARSLILRKLEEVKRKG